MSVMRWIALVGAMLTAAEPVFAQAAPQADEPHYSVAWHGSLAAAALLGSGVLARLDASQSLACSWCGLDATGQPRVPRLDAWAHAQWRWDNERRAASISHGTVSAAYVWPLIGLTAVHGGLGRAWGRDVVAALDTIALTQIVTDATKRIVRRSRPHVVFDAQPIEVPGDVHSFFSGHTASAFAAVVGAATIAGRRHSRHARWIWAGGLGLSAATGYLRIAGNRHYLTDVLTGAAVGTTAGLLVPRLFDGQPGQAPVATTLPLTGLGPVTALGPRGAFTVQFGAGPRGIGLLGAVRVP